MAAKVLKSSVKLGVKAAWKHGSIEVTFPCSDCGGHGHIDSPAVKLRDFVRESGIDVEKLLTPTAQSFVSLNRPNTDVHPPTIDCSKCKATGTVKELVPLTDFFAVIEDAQIGFRFSPE